MLYIGQNYLTAKTQKVVLSSPKLKGDFHLMVTKDDQKVRNSAIVLHGN